MIARVGRLFTTPMGRWSWTRAFHRLLHRDPYKACVVCVAVWRYLDTVPGFRESVAQGAAQARAGLVVPFTSDDNAIGCLGEQLREQLNRHPGEADT